MATPSGKPGKVPAGSPAEAGRRGVPAQRVVRRDGPCDRGRILRHRSSTVCPIDPHHSDEKAFLQNLSQSLKLPSGLVSRLDAQVAQNLET